MIVAPVLLSAMPANQNKPRCPESVTRKNDCGFFSFSYVHSLLNTIYVANVVVAVVIVDVVNL